MSEEIISEQDDVRGKYCQRKLMSEEDAVRTR
jgi:hypothetical protein